MGLFLIIAHKVCAVGIIPSLLLLFIVLATYRSWKMRRLTRLIDLIPGMPSGLPFIGNSVALNVEHDEVFTRIASTRALWGRKSGLCKVWIGSKPYLCISKASAAEVVLSSSKHIDKSDDYRFLHPWLGTGLLTSSGQKWHSRRKILTPSFHFNILDDFLGVFIEQSTILASKLTEIVGKGPVNIFPFVTRCTLDVICETAMGRKVYAQSNSDSEYVQAVYRIGAIIQNRQSKVWIQPDWAFKMSSSYLEHQNCLKILHGFSNSVIRERKMRFSARHSADQSEFEDENMFKVALDGGRLAFLDLLLQASDGGDTLTDEDLREEVDTFMFEGHDTTSAALCWVLFLLGHHLDIQERAYRELVDIFGDSDRPPTINDLSAMKFIGCCIKEALRLYPSVPIFGRNLNEDVTIEGYQVPRGTTALIIAYQLHRDPEQFTNPEIFDPTRFMSKNPDQHPYAYIPFSAGPRNCIGQKFAMMEEKVVLSTILREFKLKSVDRREDLVLLAELILRPKNGLRMEFERRT